MNRRLKQLQPVMMMMMLFLFTMLTSCGKSSNGENWTEYQESDPWSVYRGDEQLTGSRDVSLSENLKVLWTMELEDHIISSPIVVNNILYGTSNSGSVFAIFTPEQKIKWKIQIEDSFEASPLYVNGYLYAGTLSGLFLKINAENGEIIWQIDLEARISGSANSLPGSKDKVYLGVYSGILYEISVQDGLFTERAQAKSYINGTPSLRGKNTLQFGACDGILYKVKIDSKKTEISGLQIGDYIAGSPVSNGDFTITAAYSGVITCLRNDEKQNKIWEWENPSRMPFTSSPAVFENTMVIGDKQGVVYGFDIPSGNILWEFRTGDSIEGSALILKDKVYIGSVDGYFYILDIESGKEIQSFLVNGSIFTSPAFYSNRIYFITDNGFVYCLGEAE